MSNEILDVNLDSQGNANLTKDDKIVTLVEIEKNKDMEINIGTGFGGTALISGFKLYNNSGGNKGSIIGSWYRINPGSQPSSEISIATSGGKSIQVTDTNTLADDALFFFGVEVTDDGTVYPTDPELRVKKITGMQMDRP